MSAMAMLRQLRFSCVKIPQMANLLIPNLHDGYFDGVWLSGSKGACFFVRTVNGERSTILLADVVALNIRNLRQGNIIFDVALIAPDALTVEQINDAYELEQERVDMAKRLLEEAQEQRLSALEMSTSYGAEGTALFRTAKVVSGHVLA
jgi:hypothetical protein